jgi:CRP/FNR family cyclic AMP-dependent transcriptional regulator
MPAQELVELLKEVPLFSRLERRERRALAERLHYEEHPKGVVIYQQGDTGDLRYFIVAKGALRLQRVDAEGRVLEVGRLERGAAFGETSLLLGDARDVTVETLEPTGLWAITKEDFDRLLKAMPQIERRLRMRPDVAERRRYPRFSWLEPGELPLKIAYRHPYFLLGQLLLPGFLFLALLAVIAWILIRGISPWWALLPALLEVVLLLVALYIYIDWKNDVYLVTNQRVISRERKGLFRESFAAAPLAMVQDISQVQLGVMSRIWSYGDLIVETAGEKGQVAFRAIPDPGGMRDFIFSQIERTRARARAEERLAIRREMRHHFLEEEIEEPKPSAPAAPSPRTTPGCLLWLTSLIPRSSHREGATVTWRKHWTVLAAKIWLPTLLLMGIIVAAAVLIPGLQEEERQHLVLALAALGAFIVTPWLLWQLQDWQNDLYQVTPTRLIDIERTPLLLREQRRETRLDRITNVRFDQSFLGKILGFGDVVVETAAGTFYLNKVANPRGVQAEIFSHIEAFQRSRQQQEARQRRAEMLDWFGVYDEIRRGRPPTETT